MKKAVFTQALLNAALTALYIVGIALFFFYASQMFGPDGKSPLIPVMMLLLFVSSAAITGFLVLGRPILWYLDGRKSDALSLLGSTIGILLVLAILTGVVLAMMNA